MTNKQKQETIIAFLQLFIYFVQLVVCFFICFQIGFISFRQRNLGSRKKRLLQALIEGIVKGMYTAFFVFSLTKLCLQGSYSNSLSRGNYSRPRPGPKRALEAQKCKKTIKPSKIVPFYNFSYKTYWFVSLFCVFLFFQKKHKDFRKK